MTTELLLNMIEKPELTPKLTQERWWAWGRRFTTPRHTSYSARKSSIRVHIAYYLQPNLMDGQSISELAEKALQGSQQGGTTWPGDFFGYQPGLYTDTIVGIGDRYNTHAGFNSASVLSLCGKGDPGYRLCITPEYPGFRLLMDAALSQESVNLRGMDPSPYQKNIYGRVLCKNCINAYWRFRNPTSVRVQEELRNKYISKINFTLLRNL